MAFIVSTAISVLGLGFIIAGIVFMVEAARQWHLMSAVLASICLLAGAFLVVVACALLEGVKLR